jgi:predicted DNA-binding transcriptional regulator YafY
MVPVEGVPHGHHAMLSLGTEVEVLEPQEVRDMLAATAATLTARYQRPNSRR